MAVPETPWQPPGPSSTQDEAAFDPPAASAEVAEAPPELWRVGRNTDPIRFAEITAADAQMIGAGNRFDVPGGRVLYCATSLDTCYAETLARFRPSAAVRPAGGEQDNGFMVCGGVTADWRATRLKVRVSLDNPLPFLNVEALPTHEFLTSAMAEDLAQLGVGVLDVSHVRGSNRIVTRAIAAWAYSAQDDSGNACYSGIRYLSRLDGGECWAIFEGTGVTERGRDTITLGDEVLLRVAGSLGLRMF